MAETKPPLFPAKLRPFNNSDNPILLLGEDGDGEQQQQHNADNGCIDLTAYDSRDDDSNSGASRRSSLSPETRRSMSPPDVQDFHMRRPTELNLQNIADLLELSKDDRDSPFMPISTENKNSPSSRNSVTKTFTNRLPESDSDDALSPMADNTTAAKATPGSASSMYRRALDFKKKYNNSRSPNQLDPVIGVDGNGLGSPSPSSDKLAQPLYRKALLQKSGLKSPSFGDRSFEVVDAITKKDYAYSPTSSTSPYKNSNNNNNKNDTFGSQLESPSGSNAKFPLSPGVMSFYDPSVSTMGKHDSRDDGDRIETPKSRLTLSVPSMRSTDVSDMPTEPRHKNFTFWSDSMVSPQAKLSATRSKIGGLSSSLRDEDSSIDSEMPNTKSPSSTSHYSRTGNDVLLSTRDEDSTIFSQLLDDQHNFTKDIISVIEEVQSAEYSEYDEDDDNNNNDTRQEYKPTLSDHRSRSAVNEVAVESQTPSSNAQQAPEAEVEFTSSFRTKLLQRHEARLRSANLISRTHHLDSPSMARTPQSTQSDNTRDQQSSNSFRSKLMDRYEAHSGFYSTSSNAHTQSLPSTPVLPSPLCETKKVIDIGQSTTPASQSRYSLEIKQSKEPETIDLTNAGSPLSVSNTTLTTPTNAEKDKKTLIRERIEELKQSSSKSRRNSTNSFAPVSFDSNRDTSVRSNDSRNIPTRSPLSSTEFEVGRSQSQSTHNLQYSHSKSYSVGQSAVSSNLNGYISPEDSSIDNSSAMFSSSTMGKQTHADHDNDRYMFNKEPVRSNSSRDVSDIYSSTNRNEQQYSRDISQYEGGMYRALRHSDLSPTNKQVQARSSSVGASNRDMDRNVGQSRDKSAESKVDVIRKQSQTPKNTAGPSPFHQKSTSQSQIRSQTLEEQEASQNDNVENDEPMTTNVLKDATKLASEVPRPPARTVNHTVDDGGLSRTASATTRDLTLLSSLTHSRHQQKDMSSMKEMLNTRSWSPNKLQESNELHIGVNPVHSWNAPNMCAQTGWENRNDCRQDESIETFKSHHSGSNLRESNSRVNDVSISRNNSENVNVIHVVDEPSVDEPYVDSIHVEYVDSDSSDSSQSSDSDEHDADKVLVERKRSSDRSVNEKRGSSQDESVDTNDNYDIEVHEGHVDEARPRERSVDNDYRARINARSLNQNQDAFVSSSVNRDASVHQNSSSRSSIDSEYSSHVDSDTDAAFRQVNNQRNDIPTPQRATNQRQNNGYANLPPIATTAARGGVQNPYQDRRNNRIPKYPTSALKNRNNNMDQQINYFDENTTVNYSTDRNSTVQDSFDEIHRAQAQQRVSFSEVCSPTFSQSVIDLTSGQRKMYPKNGCNNTGGYMTDEVGNSTSDENATNDTATVDTESKTSLVSILDTEESEDTENDMYDSFTVPFVVQLLDRSCAWLEDKNADLTCGFSAKPSLLRETRLASPAKKSTSKPFKLGKNKPKSKKVKAQAPTTAQSDANFTAVSPRTMFRKIEAQRSRQSQEPAFSADGDHNATVTRSVSPQNGQIGLIPPVDDGDARSGWSGSSNERPEPITVYSDSSSVSDEEEVRTPTTSNAKKLGEFEDQKTEAFSSSTHAARASPQSSSYKRPDPEESISLKSSYSQYLSEDGNDRSQDGNDRSPTTKSRYWYDNYSNMTNDESMPREDRHGYISPSSTDYSMKTLDDTRRDTDHGQDRMDTVDSRFEQNSPRSLAYSQDGISARSDLALASRYDDQPTSPCIDLVDDDEDEQEFVERVVYEDASSSGSEENKQSLNDTSTIVPPANKSATPLPARNNVDALSSKTVISNASPRSTTKQSMVVDEFRPANEDSTLFTNVISPREASISSKAASPRIDTEAEQDVPYSKNTGTFEQPSVKDTSSVRDHASAQQYAKQQLPSSTSRSSLGFHIRTTFSQGLDPPPALQNDNDSVAYDQDRVTSPFQARLQERLARIRGPDTATPTAIKTMTRDDENRTRSNSVSSLKDKISELQAFQRVAKDPSPRKSTHSVPARLRQDPEANAMTDDEDETNNVSPASTDKQNATAVVSADDIDSPLRPDSNDSLIQESKNDDSRIPKVSSDELRMRPLAAAPSPTSRMDSVEASRQDNNSTTSVVMPKRPNLDRFKLQSEERKQAAGGPEAVRRTHSGGGSKKNPVVVVDEGTTDEEEGGFVSDDGDSDPYGALTEEERLAALELAEKLRRRAATLKLRRKSRGEKQRAY